MSTQSSEFDKIMEVVGNDGKFQKVFNRSFTVGLVCLAAMAHMNVILVLNEPDHTCQLPPISNLNLDSTELKNLLIPM